jgi:hypothetical protein
MAEGVNRLLDLFRSLPSAKPREAVDWLSAMYQMDIFERCFVAFTFVGSLGVVGVVIWMMMH